MQNLQTALIFVGHLRNINQPSTEFGVVQAEIAAGRPLCVAYQLLQGGLHYLVITGCDAASNQIMLIDPASGVPSHGPYDSFLNNSRARWMGWIFTQ
jgi:hypothetical protein